MARFVYIARHAWAGEWGDPRWPDDSLRELEPDGSERYMRVVEALAERGFAPQVVVTSPYIRCRQTADIIASYTAHTPEVVELAALEPGSDFDAVVKWTADADADEVCWVGHAPDVGNMTAALVGDGSGDIRFAKGAVAAVRLNAQVGHGCGELYWLATAKSLGL